MNVLVSSMDEKGGFALYHLTADGTLIEQKKVEMPAIMYGCQYKDRFYFSLREPFVEAQSAVTSLSCQADTFESNIVPCNGSIACHISVSPNGQTLYTANYRSGSISEFHLDDSGNILKLNRVISLPLPHEDSLPHAHGVFFIQDKKILCVPDLGNDCVYFYPYNKDVIGDAIGSIAFPQGSGPRHIAVSPDEKTMYVVAQNSCQVFAISETGQIVSCVSTCVQKGSQASAIRMSKDGNFLYVSNRGANTISVISVEGEEMKLINQAPCGNNPRDFALSPDGKWLVVGNMDDDTVAVYSVHTSSGELKFHSQYGFRMHVSVIFTS